MNSDMYYAICKVISNQCEFSTDDVWKCYSFLKSIDFTINATIMASASASSLSAISEIIFNVVNYKKKKKTFFQKVKLFFTGKFKIDWDA